MKSHRISSSPSRHRAAFLGMPKQQSPEENPMQLMDRRPDAFAQADLQEQINNSPRMMQMRAYQESADQLGQQDLGQLGAPLQGKFPSSQQASSKVAPAGTAGQGVVQLKGEYLNGGVNHVETAWARIQEYETENEIPVEKRLSYHEFVYGIAGLTLSEIDYGTIDLKSPQQVGVLYYGIRKQAENLSGMAKKQLGSRQEQGGSGQDHKSIPIEHQEAAAKQKREDKERSDQAYYKNSPDPARTFELAILGAGAAAAYYLTSLGKQLDRDRTILIGLQQPWAAQRGPGVINHPEHMISVLRDEVGLKDEQLMDRQAFSDSIEAVISSRVSHRLVQEVTKVDKIEHNSTPYYQINYGDGKETIYAKKVVAGLGIGPHRNLLTQGSREIAKERAMDMDTFQHRAATLATGDMKPGDITVFIAGGNAAIDTVNTCIEFGFRIIWYPGGNEPMMLRGTNNEVVEAEHQKFAQQKQSKIAFYKKERAKEIKQGTHKPLSISDHEADYYVYAQGPDVDKVKGVFNKERILDRLETMKDKSRYFRGGQAPAALGLQMPVDPRDPTALEIIGGSAFRMANPEQLQEFGGVIDTLPSNVVVNDQLTATRAQVEASMSFVPSYVENDVNMATDNITVIAMYIAINYPDLSLEDANMWADRIIRWRRPSPQDIETYRMLQGPIPNPLNKPRENAESFSAWFKKRLTEENAKAKQRKG
jgi:hypothetical protein